MQTPEELTFVEMNIPQVVAAWNHSIEKPLNMTIGFVCWAPCLGFYSVNM